MGWEMPGEDLEERPLVPSLEVVPLLRIRQTDRLLQQEEEDFQRQEVVEELGAGRTYQMVVAEEGPVVGRTYPCPLLVVVPGEEPGVGRTCP